MKFGKAAAGVALSLALALPLAQPAAAAANVLSVGGENLWNQASARLVEGGTTYVSLRTVAEVLAPGAQVTWENGVARVRGEGVTLAAKPGERWLTVNDRALYIPHGVLLENGRTLVPVRALAEALGGEVDWSREAGVTLTPGSGRAAAPAYTAEELYWLSRIISAESRGEPLLGKIAVGTVVLNRVASREFPNNIHDVLFQKNQFTPASSGSIYREPNEESVVAAMLVIDGAQVTPTALFFNGASATNSYAARTRTYVTTIGNHAFYK